jgi:hypothetical protein
MPLSARELVRFAILEDLLGGPRTRGELVAALRSPISAAAASGGEPVDLGAVKPALRELVDEGLVHEHGAAGAREPAGEPLWMATVAGRTAFVLLSIDHGQELGRWLEHG